MFDVAVVPEAAIDLDNHEASRVDRAMGAGLVWDAGHEQVDVANHAVDDDCRVGAPIRRVEARDELGELEC